jgi:hypothetical protein
MDLYERVAENIGGVRSDIEWAIKCGVPPTVFLRERTVEGPWTDKDTAYVRAFAYYEAGLCPGGPHVLAETSKPEHADAYRPDKDRELRCHHCAGSAVLARATADDDDTAGVMVPLKLDPEIVARNLLPVPDPPTAEQLQQRAIEDAKRMEDAMRQPTPAI